MSGYMTQYKSGTQKAMRKDTRGQKKSPVQDQQNSWSSKTNLESNFRPIPKVAIKCGKYQGAALSPAAVLYRSGT